MHAYYYISPQSEYRPTEYIQNWMSFWFDDDKRLKAAKRIQQLRLDYMHRVWSKDKDLKSEGFTVDDPDIQRAITEFSSKIQQCTDVTKLLLIVAQLTKILYRIAANRTKLNVLCTRS